MKKYTFRIKFENSIGGTSTEIFSCKSLNEKEARKILSLFLIETDKLGSVIELIK